MSDSAGCPSAETLSAWLDDELGAEQARAVRNHVEGCTVCREEATGWLQSVREMQQEEITLPIPSDSCLDEESLVAYSEGELEGVEAAGAEHHLLGCRRCAGEVQRLVRLRIELEAEATKQSAAEAPVRARRSSAAPSSVISSSQWWARLRETWSAITSSVTQPWGVVGAVAATALLVLVIVQILPVADRGGDIGLRGSEADTVEVIADGVAGRARPGEAETIITILSRGTVVTQLERSQDWIRVQLLDGRRVWVRSSEITKSTSRTP